MLISAANSAVARRDGACENKVPFVAAVSLETRHPLRSAEEARQVVRYYELRWCIEVYHKAWKSGVGVERQCFQTVNNLERILVITAFLAEDEWKAL